MNPPPPPPEGVTGEAATAAGPIPPPPPTSFLRFAEGWEVWYADPTLEQPTKQPISTSSRVFYHNVNTGISQYEPPSAAQSDARPYTGPGAPAPVPAPAHPVPPVPTPYGASAPAGATLSRAEAKRERQRIRSENWDEGIRRANRAQRSLSALPNSGPWFTSRTSVDLRQGRS